MRNGPQKVVLCGAGFLGSYTAKALVNTTHLRNGYKVTRSVQVTSRNPERLFKKLKTELPAEVQLTYAQADITRPETLEKAFENSDVVVSLVGILNGSRKEFEDIQWRGAENVASAVKKVGAKLVHISAIGANAESKIDYARTKAWEEGAVRRICGNATIIRPSIIFGPGDSFFARFATLSKYLPFLPVFGGGTTKFQPVYAGDVAYAVEIACRTFDEECTQATSGKIIEAGGPDVFTYREIMELVRIYTGRIRPIVSLPYAVGYAQGFVLEKLPPNIFTLTRSQVEQLKIDNIVDPTVCKSEDHADFEKLLQKFGGRSLTSVREILPAYL